MPIHSLLQCRLVAAILHSSSIKRTRQQQTEFTCYAGRTDIFTGGPKFSGKNGPPGPMFRKFWSPGPIFPPDQNFRDSPLRLSEFYLHRFRLQVLLLMDTHTSFLRRALKLAQEQEVAEDWRWPRNERATELDVLQALRNKGARK